MVGFDHRDGLGRSTRLVFLHVDGLAGRGGEGSGTLGGRQEVSRGAETRNKFRPHDLSLILNNQYTCMECNYSRSAQPSHPRAELTTDGDHLTYEHSGRLLGKSGVRRTWRVNEHSKRQHTSTDMVPIATRSFIEHAA